MTASLSSTDNNEAARLIYSGKLHNCMHNRDSNPLDYLSQGTEKKKEGQYLVTERLPNNQ